jgi:hypothetical protein
MCRSRSIRLNFPSVSHFGIHAGVVCRGVNILASGTLKLVTLASLTIRCPFSKILLWWC